jgi:hypothetical protein
MKRREVIVFLGAGAIRPLDALAQQERVRRIGVVLEGPENDRWMLARFAGVREGLKSAGWLEGQESGVPHSLGQ